MIIYLSQIGISKHKDVGAKVNLIKSWLQCWNESFLGFIWQVDLCVVSYYTVSLSQSSLGVVLDCTIASPSAYKSNVNH